MIISNHPALLLQGGQLNYSSQLYSCNMDKSSLADVYTQEPQAQGAKGVAIYQANHECPCYNYYVPLSYRLQTHVCNKQLIPYVGKFWWSKILVNILLIQSIKGSNWQVKHWNGVLFAKFANFSHAKIFTHTVIANIKPTSTTTPYPLGYKYNCEIIYNRVKLPIKVFTKNGSGVLQTMEFQNVDY